MLRSRNGRKICTRYLLLAALAYGTAMYAGRDFGLIGSDPPFQNIAL